LYTINSGIHSGIQSYYNTLLPNRINKVLT
jgi:hypothetical protein